MSIVDALEQASEWTLGKIKAVEAGSLGAQTPCTEWDVRAVASHVTAGLKMIGRAARGEEPRAWDTTGRSEPDHVGDDPAGAYAAERDAALSALREPGVLDRNFKMPFGETPAPMALSIFTTDQLVHGWDIAKATGQDTTMPAELVEAAWKTVNGRIGDDRRGEGMPFQAEVNVAEDAPTQDKLVGYLGRSP
jgi:uncharacterized protein (TIGR03086 family)